MHSLRTVVSAYSYNIKNKTRDFYYKNFRKLTADIFFIASRLHYRRTSAISFLLASNRIYRTARATEEIVKQLPFIAKHATFIFDGKDNATLKQQRSRILELKPAKISEFGEVGEKGVLLIKFTGTLQYVIEKLNIEKLLAQYFLVIEPSWSGYSQSEILWFTQFTDPIIIEAADEGDYNFIKDLSSNLIPVRIGSGDWVDQSTFKPLPNVEKVYDSIYVSNTTNIKRNHIYIDAISKIEDEGYRGLLVLSSWGNGKKQICDYIKIKGVEAKIDVTINVGQDELNKLLNQSKVNLLLSLKEGSNRSIFEGFFSNTPAIILEQNIGVNKECVNSSTGIILKDEKHLPKVLTEMSTAYADYTPLKWAIENNSATISTNKINEILKSFSESEKHEWSSDIFVKVNTPEARILDKKNWKQNFHPTEFEY